MASSEIRRYRSFTISFKLKAVDVAEKTNKSNAAKEFNVDVKRIREWCKQKDQLLAKVSIKQSKKKCLSGAGRKPLNADMEDVLLEWITDLRSRNLRVSRRMIMDHARLTFSQSSPGFKASRGWLQKFMKRQGLSLRRKTTVCQSTPEDYIPKLISFILYMRKLQVTHNYSKQSIFAMDETACWFDMMSDTTVAETGSRAVPIKTTGHEKDHFTVVLTARADGKKMKPFVVFKGKGTRLIKQLDKIPGVIVRFSTNGWLNDTLTSDYLESVIGRLSFDKRLLVWDAYKCHTSDETRNKCAQMKLHTAIVPGGCTRYIQAADVVWNSTFKSHLRQYYDLWLADSSKHEYTKGGNLKSPSRSLLCEWVKMSWDAVPTATVIKSFLSCAITTSPNGDDDDEIHCFKAGQQCEGGRLMLQQEMARFNEVSEGIEEDPFASDEDQEETELNEACIEDDLQPEEQDSSSEDEC